MISGREALRRLRDGNLRFASGEGRRDLVVDEVERARLVDGQAPFATVLGCSDSRVPTEIVFDQGLGDLFVIRVAGNVVASSQIGSVEFAAGKLGTPLVVVLGHTGCGAVRATLEELRRDAADSDPVPSPHLRSIVERIRPAVQSLLETGLAADPAALERSAVRANVRASANQLRHGSAVLEQLVEDGELLIVGAEYSLESGEVDFFDAP